MIPIQPTSLTGVPESPVVYIPGDKSVAKDTRESAAKQSGNGSEQQLRAPQQGQDRGEVDRHRTPDLPTSDVWQIPFADLDMKAAIDHIGHLIQCGEPSQVITANLNYVMLHHREPGIREITRDAAMILADGQPIVWRSVLGKRPLPERVAGSEMIHHLARRAAESNWGMYFLGGNPGVAHRCAERLLTTNPGLRIAGVESPPFRELTAEESEQQEARIRRSGAQILLVALGQPKGERWIHERHRRLGVPVCIQLGASFDFIAGTAKRAPRGWQKLGVEWLYRMCHDPARLVPRYSSNALFLASMLVKEFMSGRAAAKSRSPRDWTEPERVLPTTSRLPEGRGRL